MIRTKNWQLQARYRRRIPSTSYLTHGIHPYTAKLIPHIPHHIIKEYSRKGDIVLDPFCGSGTTLLEARLLERNGIGIDLNPLAVLISKVKTKPLKMKKLESAIRLAEQVLKNGNGTSKVSFPNIDYWFHNKVQNELSKIKASLEELKGQVDESIYRFLLVCFSKTIRKSSYADPRMAKTYRSKRVLEKIEKGWIPRPIEYFEQALDENLARVKSLPAHLTTNRNWVRAYHGDARKMAVLLTRKGIHQVDLIVTSPPYINAQDYFRSYKLELWWLGLATYEEVLHLKRQAIGTEYTSANRGRSRPRSTNWLLENALKKVWKSNKAKAYMVHNYFENMREVLVEAFKVLKARGFLCIVMGNNVICEVRIPAYKIVVQIAEDVGFEVVEIARDAIKNHALPPTRNHNGGVIKEEWITVLRKS